VKTALPSTSSSNITGVFWSLLRLSRRGTNFRTSIRKLHTHTHTHTHTGCFRQHLPYFVENVPRLNHIDTTKNKSVGEKSCGRVDSALLVLWRCEVQMRANWPADFGFFMVIISSWTQMSQYLISGHGHFFIETKGTIH